MAHGNNHVFAAIDVGTNAVRLEIARMLPDGSRETLHQERDPIRPGEGVYANGVVSAEVADRLLSTLRRYGALSKRYGARVMAVATSALRDAKNGPEIVRRARDHAGVPLEVVSGREEARLICLGVLQGRPGHARSLVLDIGGGSTEVALARGEEPTDLWSVPLGAVRLTEIFETGGRVAPSRLAALRTYAAEAFREAIPADVQSPRTGLGSSGTIQAVVDFASDGDRRATRRDVSDAVDELAAMSVSARRQRFDARRAEIVVAGAAILEAAMRHLGLASVAAVDTGLRNGILVELSRAGGDVGAPADALLELGRRFAFDEAHAHQVARVALRLFDRGSRMHGLPASARRVLEAAALLHDLGHAVSPNAHHKHSYYLISNADLPGFGERERQLVALVARYHRRSAPDRHRADLEPLSASEFRTVRRLATLLRIADALDRSHRQPVRAVDLRVSRRAVALRLNIGAPVDLELWDAGREARLFRQVFGRRLEIVARRVRAPRRPGSAPDRVQRRVTDTSRERHRARVP